MIKISNKTLLTFITVSAFLMISITKGFSQTPEPQGSVDRAMLEAPALNAEIVHGEGENVIVEYLSLTCPACAQFHTETEPNLLENYVNTGKVKFVQRFLLRNRVDAAVTMLAMCAKDENHALVSAFLSQQTDWMRSDSPLKKIKEISAAHGINDDAFEACLANKDQFDAIFNASEKASKDFDVNSTPTIFVNGQKYLGAIQSAEFSAIIDPIVGQ